MLVEAIPFETLRSTAVLDDGSDVDAPAEEVAIGSSVVRVGRVPGVLYVPELGLQVASDRVPQESLVDDWDLDFERRRDYQGRSGPYRSSFEAEELDDEVAILANFFSANFGHWLTDELVKVLILERSGFTGKYVTHGLPRFAAASLEMLGVAPGRLIDQVERPTVYRAAWYTTTIYEDRAPQYPDVYLALRDALLQASRPTAEAAERVWMERAAGLNSPRTLVNADEVHALLREHGFVILDMATRPLGEQVHIAGRAHVLAGVHGAGFAHSLFMPAGGSVIECFSPRHVNPSVFGLCDILDHRYSMLVYGHHYDTYEHGQAVLVDLRHLELVLRHLEGSPDGHPRLHG